MSASETITPRFVAVGDSVYDRELNRYTRFMFPEELTYDLAALNQHGETIVDDYQWEDAK